MQQYWVPWWGRKGSIGTCKESYIVQQIKFLVFRSMARHLHACHGLNILSTALVSGQQCTALIHVYLPPSHLDSIPHYIEAVDHFPNTTLTSTSTTSRMNGPESSRDHPFWQSKTFRYKKTSKTARLITKFTTTPDVNISFAHIKADGKCLSLWRSIIQWPPTDEVAHPTTSPFQLPRATFTTKKLTIMLDLRHCLTVQPLPLWEIDEDWYHHMICKRIGLLHMSVMGAWNRSASIKLE